MKLFQGLGNRLGIGEVLLTFLWRSKLWWLTPIVFVVILMGLLILFSSGSSIGPFEYNLF